MKSNEKDTAINNSEIADTESSFVSVIAQIVSLVFMSAAKLNLARSVWTK